METEYIFKGSVSEEKLDTTLTEQPKLLPGRQRRTQYTSGCDSLRRTQHHFFPILIRGMYPESNHEEMSYKPQIRYILPLKKEELNYF